MGLWISAQIDDATDALFDDRADLIIGTRRDSWPIEAESEGLNIRVYLPLHGTPAKDGDYMARRIARADTMKIRVAGMPFDISPVTDQMARLLRMTRDAPFSEDPKQEKESVREKSPSEKAQGKEEDDEIYVVVGQQPDCGGVEALQKKVEYPKKTKKKGLEGRVFVQFVVNEKGEVVNPKVTQGVHSILNEEALKAVKKLDCEPGFRTYRGDEPVKVQMSLPVTFGK